MADRQTGRNSDQFNLRLPEGMRDRISEEAKKSGRSMNAEIVHRLGNSLDFPKFEDAAIGLGDEELDWDLMYHANNSGRSLRDEMIQRLRESLSHQPTLVSELKEQALAAERKYNDAMKLLMQLTPEEKRLLEERVEIVDIVTRTKVSSKNLGRFVRLNPIGNRGRFTLQSPKTDYSPIFDERTTSDEVKAIAEETRHTDD